MNILIVDDDKDYQDYLEVVLQELAYVNISRAMSVDGALVKINNANYDYLITDLIMPGKDGVQLLRILADSEFSGKIIIISSTGSKLLDSVYRLAQIYNLNIVGCMDKQQLAPQKLEYLLKKSPPLNKKCNHSNAAKFSCHQLEQAIAKQQLLLYYQPKVSAESGKVKGLEALVRWQHPSLGLLLPDVFINQIERCKLNAMLSQWVIKQALADFASIGAVYPQLGLSINLSVLALYQHDLPQLALAEIAKHQLSAGRVTFEITESQLLEKASLPLENIARLSLHGFKLSIDDFGTGYSSLEQLHHLPFDELKIDRVFVQEAPYSKQAAVIIDSCIKMAEELQLDVVVEGVESAEIFSSMRQFGAKQLQGYFIAKPMQLQKIKQWLRQQK